MPERSRDLRPMAMPSAGQACDKSSNKRREKIGRDALSRWFRIVVAALATFCAGGIASAQAPFPLKPVHIYVPYPAGGAVDVLCLLYTSDAADEEDSVDL